MLVYILHTETSHSLIIIEKLGRYTHKGMFITIVPAQGKPISPPRVQESIFTVQHE